MAAFVKSVEQVSATFGTTSGATSITVNLSKGQDEAKCVPFYTARTTAAGSDIRENDFFGLEMIDNGGTPAVKVHRNASTTVSEKEVEIFVVEFGANITVQQGNVLLAGGTEVTDTITAVTEANSFGVFSQVAVVGTSDDWENAVFQMAFGSTTTVKITQNEDISRDWTIYWYVVESDGTDFTTEFVQNTLGNTEKGPTGITIASVTIAKAFVIATYDTNEHHDDMKDGVANVAITGATTLTHYRDHDSTPANRIRLSAWIVKTGGTEFSVQRVADDLAASTTNDEDITAIDQTKAIVINSQYIGGGAWSVDGTSDGPDNEDRQNSLVFLDNDTVRAQQQEAEASSGANSRLRYEIIEFELETAAQIVAIGLVTETDLAQAITVAKARAVGLVTETDLAQAMTVAKARAVGLVTETDLAQPIDVEPLRRLINQALETDLAQPIDVEPLRRLINQALETDLAQPIDVEPLRRLINQALETDLAQPIIVAKARAIGLVTETDLAQAITVEPLRRLIKQALETDLAQTLTRVKARAIGLVTETDLAQPVDVEPLRRLINQALETDLAQTLTRVKARAIGLVTETDLAQPVTVGAAQIIAIGLVTETDLAQPIDVEPLRRLIKQALETDLAQPIDVEPLRRLINQALETDLAQPIDVEPLRRLIKQALETDLAQPIAVAPLSRLISQALETDLAQPIAVAPLRRLINQALETNLAQAMTFAKGRALGLVTETDLAQAMTFAKARTIGQAIEFDLALALITGPPTLPGLEYSALANRLHFDALKNLPHYQAARNRLHYETALARQVHYQAVLERSHYDAPDED